MANRLVEIPIENWLELRDLYRRNWPEHVFAYGIISNYLWWKQSRQDHCSLTDVRIFSLNDTWKENGTFLLFDHFEIYFYSFDAASGYASLSDALLLVEWSSLRLVSMDFLDKHRVALDRVILVKNLQVVNDEITNFYYLPKESAIKNEACPHDARLRLRPIPIDYLDYVYQQWPLKDAISKTAGYDLLRRLILLNESIGLFDEDGNLLSWCLRDQTGAFSDLQTREDQLRRGYGRQIVKEFARRLANSGDDSYAFVLSSNHKSCRLFESVGFGKIADLHWVVIKQKTDD